MKHFSLFFAFILFLISCNSQEQKKEYRTLFATPQDTTLSKLRAAPQMFLIDGTKDTIIKGQSGIKIAIGANIFVDKKGTPVSNVQLELLEAIDVQSFVENGLTTLSGDKILESGGMFYINATANGQPIDIKDKEALTLSVPSSSVIGNMKVFYGKYSQDGQLDWQTVEGEENMELDFNMIAIPLKYIDYKRKAQELKESLLFSDPIFIEQMEQLSNPKYEGTFIATHEFGERLDIHLLGAFTNPDKSVFKSVMDIYKKHIQGTLWEADQEVFEYLTPHYIDLMQQMEGGNDDKLGLAKGFKEFGKHCWSILESYPKAKYTRPIDFATLGINTQTTKQDLLDKGISPAKADRLLYMYNEYTYRVNEYQSKKTFEEVKSYTVSVSKLGWVNIDRFLNDPNCKESKLEVIAAGVDSNTVKLMLIFPIRNICVEAINKNGNKYSFTNKSGLYRKLPIGEEAVLVGLSSKNGIPYFGFQKIKIEEEGEFKVSLSASNMNEIKSTLAKVLKANKPSL